MSDYPKPKLTFEGRQRLREASSKRQQALRLAKRGGFANAVAVKKGRQRYVSPTGSNAKAPSSDSAGSTPPDDSAD